MTTVGGRGKFAVRLSWMRKDQLADAQEQLAQSNEASLKTYEESVKALSVNADAASALTREMDELNKADEKSATHMSLTRKNNTVHKNS